MSAFRSFPEEEIPDSTDIDFPGINWELCQVREDEDVEAPQLLEELQEDSHPYTELSEDDSKRIVDFRKKVDDCVRMFYILVVRGDKRDVSAVEETLDLLYEELSEGLEHVRKGGEGGAP